MDQDVPYHFLRLIRQDHRNEDVFQALWVRVVLRASTLPLQEGNVGLVRQRWVLGVDKIKPLFPNLILGRVCESNDEACVLRISDELEFSIAANGLCEN